MALATVHDHRHSRMPYILHYVVGRGKFTVPRQLCALCILTAQAGGLPQNFATVPLQNVDGYWLALTVIQVIAIAINVSECLYTCEHIRSTVDLLHNCHLVAV